MVNKLFVPGDCAELSKRDYSGKCSENPYNVARPEKRPIFDLTKDRVSESRTIIGTRMLRQKLIPFLGIRLPRRPRPRLNLSGWLDSEDRARYDRFRETLTGIFGVNFRKGVLPKEDPYHLAVTLQSVSSDFVFFWLKAPVLKSYSENIHAVARLFFNEAKPQE